MDNTSKKATYFIMNSLRKTNSADIPKHTKQTHPRDVYHMATHLSKHPLSCRESLKIC
jgi:hypothetical protein